MLLNQAIFNAENKFAIGLVLLYCALRLIKKNLSDFLNQSEVY